MQMMTDVRHLTPPTTDSEQKIGRDDMKTTLEYLKHLVDITYQ